MTKVDPPLPPSPTQEELRGYREYTVRVRQVFKGKLGRYVRLRHYGDGSCGFHWRVGQRVGFYLYGDKEPFDVGICSALDPAELRVALARRLPRPQSRAPIAFLAGGFGKADARVIALDRSGRTVAYGYGSGTVSRIGACPGGRRVVEAVRGPGRRSLRLAVRRTDTMAVVREIDFRQGFGGLRPAASGLSCRDPAARSIVALLKLSSVESRLVEISGARRRMLFSRWVNTIAFGNRHAYISGYVDRRRTGIIALDLRTGRQRVLASDVSVGGLGVSPRETGLAALVEGHPGQVLLLRLGRTSAPLKLELPHGAGDAELRWLGEGRFLYMPTDSLSRTTRVFDRSLNELRSFHWGPAGGAVLDGRLYGLLGDRLYSVTPERGRPRTLRELFGNSSAPLVALSRPVRFRPAARRACLKRAGRRAPTSGGSR